MNKLIDRTPRQDCAAVLIPWFTPTDRPSDNRVQETTGLTEALGCSVAFVRTEQIRRVSPSNLLPSGILDRLTEDIRDTEVNLLIIDGALKPVQQRNIEKCLKVKVIDRTGLILEIFGLRARTKEGRLQVELARQLYERSRLVRTWTHLERQRGGRGFLSGPGESQLEADKRMLNRRVQKLRADLEAVRRTRRLQRQGRNRSGIPVIALIGYTNAGKSTLFNRLSGADVMAKDMPFATLDPTIRQIELPKLGRIALVDTVGFITDLPTHLIESFQATLEEALEADLLLHVRDRSSADDQQQKCDVEQVLQALETRTQINLPPLIEVWNKIDQLEPEHQAMLEKMAIEDTGPKSVCLSARSGAGVNRLMEILEVELGHAGIHLKVELKPKDGAARAWVYQYADVFKESVCAENGDITLMINLSHMRFNRFRTFFPNLKIDILDPRLD